MSYVKTRKLSNVSITMLKNVNFIDAIVSVLTLQYTLVMTFGDGVTENMLTVCAITSFAFLAFLVAVSVTNLIKAVKIKRAA